MSPRGEERTMRTLSLVEIHCIMPFTVCMPTVPPAEIQASGSGRLKTMSTGFTEVHVAESEPAGTHSFTTR